LLLYCSQWKKGWIGVIELWQVEIEVETGELGCMPFVIEDCFFAKLFGQGGRDGFDARPVFAGEGEGELKSRRFWGIWH
jgi:hypothetical protein